MTEVYKSKYPRCELFDNGKWRKNFMHWQRKLILEYLDTTYKASIANQFANYASRIDFR